MLRSQGCKKKFSILGKQVLCWTHQPGRLPREDCFTLPKPGPKGPRPGPARGCGSLLCRAPPPQLLAPSQALGEEEETQLKSTNCDCPGTQASDTSLGPGWLFATLVENWRETLEAAGGLQTRLKGKEQKCRPRQLCHAAHGSPSSLIRAGAPASPPSDMGRGRPEAALWLLQGGRC